VTGPPAAAGEASLREELDRALRRALVDVDAEIWVDTARLRAVLADLCPERGVYNQVLYQVAEFGVVAALAESRATGTTELSLSALRMLVKRLIEKTGLGDDWAEWGVRAWSYALGLKVVPERRKKALVVVPPAAPSVRESTATTATPATAVPPLAVGEPLLRPSPPARRRSTPLWALAAVLAAVLTVWGFYASLPGRTPGVRGNVEHASVAAPGNRVALTGGWGDPSRLARLKTTFVGHRELHSGLRQTLVLEVRAIVARRGQAVFLYVLNDGALRRDNAGTLGLADGRVELPDLGAGHLGLDPAGRLYLVGAEADGAAPYPWRLKAVR
jgi:hypothetical protein